MVCASRRNLRIPVTLSAALVDSSLPTLKGKKWKKVKKVSSFYENALSVWVQRCQAKLYMFIHYTEHVYSVYSSASERYKFPRNVGAVSKYTFFSCDEVSISERAQNCGLSIESHYLRCDEAPLLLR